MTDADATGAGSAGWLLAGRVTVVAAGMAGAGVGAAACGGAPLAAGLPTNGEYDFFGTRFMVDF